MKVAEPIIFVHVYLFLWNSLERSTDFIFYECVMKFSFNLPTTLL
jgi:hypothetical protein